VCDGARPSPVVGYHDILLAAGPLFAVAVMPLSKLSQHIGRVAVAGIGKATQLGHVSPLAGQLDKLIRSVRAAAVRETTQLVHVTPLARQLNELVDGVSVSACGARLKV
jgi:hypothetical protein